MSGQPGSRGLVLESDCTAHAPYSSCASGPKDVPDGLGSKSF